MDRSNTSVSLWIFTSLVSSTILILFLKVVDNRVRCRYVVTLSTYHLMTTWFVLELFAFMGYIRRYVTIPMKKRIFLALLSVLSITSMNTSLDKNSISFYQLAKLFSIPYMIFHNVVFRRAKYSTSELGAIGVVIFGVFVFSFADVEFNMKGAVYALIGVIFSSYCQMVIGDYQKEYTITGSELLLSIAPYQFSIGCIMSLFLESTGYDGFLMSEFALTDVFYIIATCALSVAVNVSTYSLIGSTSSITFQVVGHFKAALLLLLGLYFFPIRWGSTLQMLRAIIGIVSALIGAFMYIKSRRSSPLKASPDELVPLVSDRH